MSTVTASHFNAGAVSSRAEYFCSDSETDLTVSEGSGGREDYFIGAVDDLGASAWVGGGADVLGLAGQPVTGDDFAAVFSGCDPGTGKRLRRGEPKDTDRAGYDLAFNVDKSVSALYAIADNDTKKQLEQAILKAHDDAFNHAVDSDFFQTRKGAQGAIKEPVNDVLAARFLHGTSRNKDPHLHVHCEIAAICRADDGQWRTLDATELYKRQRELSYLFDVALAENLQTLGFSISENNQGVTVNGINEDLLREWSSRRREIIEELEAIGISGKGNRNTNVQVTLNSRDKKDEALNRDDLFKDWQETAKGYGYDQGFINKQKAIGDDLRSTINADELEADLLNNRSVFTARDFDRIAAKYTIGRGGIDDIKERRKELINQLEIVRLTDDFYTTKKVIDCETAVMKSAIGRQYEAFHTVTEDKVNAKIDEIKERLKDQAKANGKDPDKVEGLNTEQIAAVKHLAFSGGVAVMEGAAGTGKSFTLGAVRELYEAEGYKVRGLAPSGKAAQELQSGSGIQSETAHSLLLKLEGGKHKLDNQTVLVLDEAGMVDSVTLARLTDHAHQAGAKLILAGDSRQLEAVGTANLLRDVGREIGSAELLEIARQKDDEKREISQQFFRDSGPLAIENMVDQGLVSEAVTPADQIDQAVKKFLENSEGRAPKESLLLADSREQVSKLNDAVRRELMERGTLDGSQAVKVRLTDDHERTRDEFLMPGDRIMFRKNDREKGVMNGTTGSVVVIDGHQLAVKIDGTEEIKTVDLKKYDRLEVAWAMTVHKSQGMTADHAVYVTSDRTDNRSAYVAYTRAREGADFVTAGTAEDLGKQVARQSEKLSTISAFENEDTGKNRLVEELRKQAGESEAASINRDAPTCSRVLADRYREGVKDDLDGLHSGPEIALTPDEQDTGKEVAREIEEAEKRAQLRQKAEELKPELDASQAAEDRARLLEEIRQRQEQQEQEQDSGPSLG